MYKTIFILSFLLVDILFSTEYSQEIKDKKIYPIAKKIYDKKCKKIYDYSTKDELQEKIDQLCKTLSLKYNEYLNIYLWDYKSLSISNAKFINIKDNEKCPICGMWVSKYPKWIAQIQTKDKVFSFDGVKDMMKYYFMYPNTKANIIVRDYYSQKPIDARKSFFVQGSDVYGPMGNEFIAFSKLEEAKTFLLDHKGRVILKFNDIKEDDLEI